MNDCLNRENETSDHRQRRNERDQIERQYFAQSATLQQGSVHHQKSRDASGCERYDRYEKQSEVKLPDRRQITQAKRQRSDEYRPDNRSDEEADAADISREQDRSGLLS